MEGQGNSDDSGMINTFVFIAGFLLGAGTALLFAPEAGSNVRERLARGVRTAQDEFTGIATETKDALGTLSQEAQDAMRNTANRFTTAVDATKEAIKNRPSESVAD